MKRFANDCSEAEQARIIAAFALEQRRVLPAGWMLNPAGDFYNSACWDHRAGIRVIQEVELHDDGKLWLHVSTSLHGRTSGKNAAVPAWKDVRVIKDAFIGPDRKAFLVLPADGEYFSMYEVLHLFHCLDGDPVPDLRHATGQL
jgi:hypothetical protein